MIRLVAPDRRCDIRVGKVRYSSSRRFQERENQKIPVFVNAQDLAATRTALFGVTRTGKSNTLKKIIWAMVEMRRMRRKRWRLQSNRPR